MVGWCGGVVVGWRMCKSVEGYSSGLGVWESRRKVLVRCGGLHDSHGLSSIHGDSRALGFRV